MIEWLFTSLTMVGIGQAAKASDSRKYRKQVQTTSFVQSPRATPVRYQNKGKQMMYEVYLKDMKENPQWAAFKVKHNGYGGYEFDNSEN